MASVKFYKNDIAYPKVLADKLNKLADMPDAMEFKGSLGVGGTITALPVDGSAKKGDTYKVITDGTYAGQTAKIGDLFICNEKTSSSNTWVLIPSGDEPSGTVTSVKIEANAPISVNDSTPITSSGTRIISHNTSGANAGSYGPTADVVGTDNTTIKVPQITVDSYGHITGVAERTYTSKDADTKVTSADNHYGYASGSGKASGLYKVATDDAGHVTETTAVAKADITALGIPDSDTNTHRPIQVDGTEVLGDNVTPLNLSGGTNISLSDDGNGKLTIDANIPKTEHELIYFDPDNISINDGLFTQQLMYEDGIVVDNPTDLSKCKGENDFAFLEIKDTWGTELISDTKTDVGNTDYLKPGGIENAKNGFWFYNASANTLDAKFNDNNYSRYAFLYNPDTSTYVFHDALYGFYENSSLNDTIGCGFIGFGTTPETDGDGTWYPTVVLRFNPDPIQKPRSIFRACNMGFVVYKRRQNYTPHTYIADNYLTQTPAYSFGIIGTSSSNKVTGSSVENGKCVVLNTELINVPSSWGDPGEGGGTYYGPSYVRVITEKDGDVITWKFSQILSGKITDLETQKPDIIIGTKVQIDLANYKVRYITSGETSWNEYNVENPYKKYFDILKNDTHFGFGQSSTPSGRIYNITTSEHRLLLDIDTDNVWKNVNGTWSIYQGKTPLELMTGSRLNYNNITEKLWYSNGSQIYELKTGSGGGGTGGTSGINITTSSEDETYPILLGNTNDAESNVTNIQKSIGLVVNPKKKSVAEGEGTTATGNYSHAEGHGLDSNEIVTFVCSKIGAEEQKAIYAKTGINFTYCVKDNTINDAYGSQGYIYNDKACTQFISEIDVCRFYSVDNYHGDYFNIKKGSSLTNGNTYYWKRVCLANGDFSHVEGNSTTASGESAHAEGSGTTASGNYSHAEGSGTTASGIHSHAEGSSTIAYSDFSHAEGGRTIASGVYAHAEGNNTIASGVYAHAEGGGTIASGVYAHAEGSGTTASGNYSHASGQYTIANRKSQTVVGEYNDESLTGALFVVGNGTGEESKSNAFYVKNDGSVYASGAYYSASDKRKKDIIGNIDLEKAYSLLETCQTVTYTWKDDESKKQQVGVIAQEIQQFFPEIVNEDEHGMLSVDYSRLTVILLAVIRDLTQKVSKIDTLEEKIKQLENKIQ